ncbi:Apc13 domain-containing protein [Seiridium cupressi]
MIHLHAARHADLFEDFCSPHSRLPDDEVYVPPHHQPINPEDEDDVVPDQHAAFGIQKATQKVKEPAWKDLGLAGLMGKGPSSSSAAGNGGKGNGGFARGLPR